MISILLWINCGYISNSIDQYYLSLVLMKLRFAAVSLFLIAVYFFVVYFPKEEKRHLILDRAVLVIGIFLFSFSIFTNLIIKSVEFKSWGTEIIFGNGVVLFWGMIFLLTFLIISLLIEKYCNSSEAEKLKIKYFLIGVIIFALLNIIFNVIFPSVLNTYKYYQFGDYSAIFLFTLTAYAITKHELMGIKTLITQTLIVIISIILLMDLLFITDGLTMQLLKAGILLTFLYFSRGMIESVRKEKKAREKLENTYQRIDHYVKDLEDINIKLEEKNEDLGVLLNISDIMARNLDPKKIAQDVVDSVPKNLNYLKYMASFLVLCDVKTKQTYAYFITGSVITKKIKKLVEKTLGKHPGEITVCLGSDNLIAETIKKREIQISNKLEDFLTPSIDVNICRIIQKLARAKSYVSVPIFSSGRVIGTIVFVSAKLKKEIVQRDRNILSGFSSHIGSAIENAELYKKTDAQMKELGKLNKSLKNANQKLEELLEMKDEFLHITSHQLRTPLTAIRGMTAMWRDGDFDNMSEREKKEAVNRIYLSAERLNNITNDMLDSMELEGESLKLQFKNISLKKIIEETIVILKTNFEERNLYLRFKTCDKDLPLIKAEPNYIKQVFMNVIDNACKYTEKGGVEIEIKKRANYLDIIIKDTGIGLGKKEQQKIFQKFTRGKNGEKVNASGSGLGLFIARKIVDDHHGSIKFMSDGVGKGSTVKISLPVK